MDAVEPGEGLHSVEAGEDLVDVHGVEEWLVEPSLELLGHDEHLVLVPAEASRRSGLSGKPFIWDSVYVQPVLVDDLAREGDQGGEVGCSSSLAMYFVDGLLVADGMEP